jgi:hypothetical protein
MEFHWQAEDMGVAVGQTCTVCVFVTRVRQDAASGWGEMKRPRVFES